MNPSLAISFDLSNAACPLYWCAGVGCGFRRFKVWRIRLCRLDRSSDAYLGRLRYPLLNTRQFCRPGFIRCLVGNSCGTLHADHLHVFVDSKAYAHDYVKVRNKEAIPSANSSASSLAVSCAHTGRRGVSGCRVVARSVEIDNLEAPDGGQR